MYQLFAVKISNGETTPYGEYPTLDKAQEYLEWLSEENDQAGWIEVEAIAVHTPTRDLFIYSVSWQPLQEQRYIDIMTKLLG